MGEVKDAVDLKCIDENLSLFKTYDEKAFYQYWVEASSSVPVSSTKKAEKQKKFSKRLLVVGKYRLFFIKKGGFASKSSRAVHKLIHFYDIPEFSATEKSDVIEMKYYDKDKSAEALAMRIKTDNVPLLLKTLRTSYRSISIDFHYGSALKFTGFDPALVALDYELAVGPANGFLETYMAQCNYHKTRPSIELSRYIQYLVENGITDLDLGVCPGIEQKSDISFDLPTVLATLAHNTYFRALIVKDVQIRGVTESLGLALQHNRTLRRVQVSNSQEDQSLASIGYAFKINPDNVVEVLDFSGNNITQESVAPFCSGFAFLTHGITVLNLSKCNLSPKGTQALFHAFEANFGVSLSIRELNLSYNRFEELGTAALTHWLTHAKGYYSLRKLWLESTNIDLVVVGPILRTINSLNVFSFAHNKIEKPDVVQELKTFIECSIALVELELSACHFTPEAVEDILQQLGKNQRLEAASVKLDISDNNLGARGALSLARALVNSNYLRSLDISKNKLRGKGVADILESLSKNQGLVELYVGKNMGGSSDGDELAKPLVDYVAAHPNLRVLHIEAGGGSNPIGRGLSPLLQALANSETIALVSLDISGMCSTSTTLPPFVRLSSSSDTT
jgi:Ran GTPase-activating protein (RanGAP) involved in mRNA processing and transport